MSKLSEHYMKEQEIEFELQLNYEEWLRDNSNEPSELELEKMELDLCRANSNTNFNPNVTTGV